MKKILDLKNNKLFFRLVLVIILIISIFVFFIHKFNSYDKNIYSLPSNSILFGKDNNYIKVGENAELKQRIDGNYYLYTNENNKTIKYEIGKNAVVYNNGDSYIYLYGKAYEVNSSGEVNIVEKETKVAKASPTKLFKLDDRKYLMVDSKIRSANDTLINTDGYLILELDKQGKANFANNELNFKAIKPIVLEGTSFKFDIANEKIVTSNDVIDLKNVIGSTNEYKENKNKKKDDNKNNEKDDQNKEFDYYEEYLNNVIKGVNNLTQSARKINENTKTKLNANSVYFDFDKWIALKKVSSTVSSINLDYVVFDPNSQYDVVEVKLIDKNNNVINNSLNKNSTSFNISNLKPNSEYRLLFGYKLKNIDDFIIVDEVVIRTKNVNYSITVDKIIEKDLGKDSKYMIYYTLNVDDNYVFNKAKVSYYMDDTDNLINQTDIDSTMLDDDKKYKGVFELPNNTRLGNLNIIKLENVSFCIDDSQNNCNNIIDINVENTFSIE